MDWSTLVVAILTSSVVGAVVSSLFSEWQKRNDYKRDYYKKIIDKRLNAYEKLEAFIGMMDIEIEYELECFEAEAYGRKKIATLNCFCSIDELQSMLRSSINICALDTWYSPGVKDLVHLINRRLVDCLDLVGKPNKEKLKKADIDFLGAIDSKNIALCMAVGEKNKANLRSILNMIKPFVIEDRMNLHEVDEFFNKKQKGQYSNNK